MEHQKGQQGPHSETQGHAVMPGCTGLRKRAPETAKHGAKTVQGRCARAAHERALTSLAFEGALSSGRTTASYQGCARLPGGVVGNTGGVMCNTGDVVWNTSGVMCNTGGVGRNAGSVVSSTDKAMRGAAFVLVYTLVCIDLRCKTTDLR
eukprot:scaffold24298_cov19-Tisochrysis_lutea.AAC.1